MRVKHRTTFLDKLDKAAPIKIADMGKTSHALGVRPAFGE